MPPSRPLKERFTEKVNKAGPVMPGMDTPCWEWMACCNEDGYGRIAANRKNEHAHRVAWEMANGPIPDGASVLHRCDNRRCVRSEPGGAGHLFLGTQIENIKDMVTKGRSSRRGGERNPRAKLTELQARDVIARLKRGESPSAIAEGLPVSSTLVRRIAAGIAWAHLPRGAPNAP